MNCWAILCPGKSLADYQDSDIVADTGCLVAINGAILGTKSIKRVPDIWALADREVFQDAINAMERQRLLSMREWSLLWCPHEWHEQSYLLDKRDEAIFRAMHKVTFPVSPAEAFTEHLPAWCHGIDWRRYTLTMALGMIARLERGPHITSRTRAAVVVRLYGADLAGRGYFTPSVQENQKTDHSERRWQDERTILGQIAERCAEQEIAIMADFKKESANG